MALLATVLTALVALIHVYIVVLEMVLWETPRGRAVFGTTRELASQTKVLAANQGLYNGFLVAGLVLALVGPEEHRFAFAVFTLSCVVVAGVYGAATASGRILLVQALPAALALGAQLLAHA
jgi:putative membrane protein